MRHLGYRTRSLGGEQMYEVLDGDGERVGMVIAGYDTWQALPSPQRPGRGAWYWGAPTMREAFVQLAEWLAPPTPLGREFGVEMGEPGYVVGGFGADGGQAREYAGEHGGRVVVRSLGPWLAAHDA